MQGDAVDCTVFGMEMMMVYASPRKQGNSAMLAKAFLQKAVSTYEINEVFLQDLQLYPCRACNWCKTHYRCLLEDGMNDLALQFKKADAICFATPVYWWGVTAQLKTFIDRLYQLQLKDYAQKSIYVIACGSDSLDGVQYRLIHDQFEAICAYTGMQFAGYLPISADDDNPAEDNEAFLEEARALFKEL